MSVATDVGGEAAASGEPVEELALEGGRASPNFYSKFIGGHVPERVSIENAIRDSFHSIPTNSAIRCIRVQSGGS